MKIRTITVGYGQTVPGDRQFESERFDLTVASEMESEGEQDPRHIGKIGGKLFESIRNTVEETSGRKMRRKKQ